jgi:hypothetical protein
MRLLRPLMAILVFSSAFVITLNVTPGNAAEQTWNTYPTNGYKIYLSPSSQSNNGCDGYVEKTGALDIGYEAAAGYGTDLVARGYLVKLGSNTASITARIDESEDWNARMHIAIHSNAGATSCGSRTAGNAGTWTIYEPSSSSNATKALADHMRYYVKNASPGTGNEIACENDTSCVNGTNLGEMWTDVPYVAYYEMEFHDWSTGVDFLEDYTWEWRVGWAVDKWFGYPPNMY